MKIRVKGAHFFRKEVGDSLSMEVEFDKSSLRDFLQDLSQRLKRDEIIDDAIDLSFESGRSYFQVVLNGCHLLHLADGLDTELKDGDEVLVYRPMAGG